MRSVIEVNGLIGETYIEPFAGGAGLALKLLMNNDVKRIVINDFDPAIYSFWYCVLNNTRDICDLLKGFLYRLKNGIISIKFILIKIIIHSWS